MDYARERSPCAARIHRRCSLLPVSWLKAPSPSSRSKHTSQGPKNRHPESATLFFPLPGWRPERLKARRSLADERLRGPAAASRSSRPPREVRWARAAPLPACEAVTMGAARAAPGGSWQASAAPLHGRSPAQPALCEDPGSPRWSAAGAGGGRPSWDVWAAPLRRSMWSGDGLERGASLSAGRHGHDGRALRGGSRGSAGGGGGGAGTERVPAGRWTRSGRGVLRFRRQDEEWAGLTQVPKVGEPGLAARILATVLRGHLDLRLLEASPWGRSYRVEAAPGCLPAHLAV